MHVKATQVNREKEHKHLLAKPRNVNESIMTFYFSLQCLLLYDAIIRRTQQGKVRSYGTESKLICTWLHSRVNYNTLCFLYSVLLFKWRLVS